MSVLSRDAVEGHACECGGGGVPGAQREQHQLRAPLWARPGPDAPRPRRSRRTRRHAHHRGVADAVRSGAVDAADDLAALLDR